MTHGSPIQKFMTMIPHAVDASQSVTDALRHMHALHVGHLPVVDSDRLVGMLSERELERLSDVRDFHPDSVPAADVMRSEICSVAPDTELREAVQCMRDQHSDCCAVIEGERVIGILTSSDALRILAELLDAQTPAASAMRPSAVRDRILDEHELLRALFRDIEQLIERVHTDTDADDEAEGALRERCRELYLTLMRHIELENRVLEPALRTIDGFGPVRADQLLSEHASQTRTLIALLEMIDAVSTRDLATTVAGLLAALRSDMMHEERALLHPDLLRDDVIEVGSTG